jgi:hypothetical protein
MTIPDNSFVAFFSYARLNDEHDRGKLTSLRKLLQSEVWVQTGKLYPIFQDQEHIEWGQNWKNRIMRVLDSSSLLIAIITPSYLVSQSCRFEFEYFLKQESLRGKKLILPILYVDTPGLENTMDEIAVEISRHQWADWRDLRFSSLTSAKTTRNLELLAKQVRDLISDETLIVNSSSQYDSSFPPDSILRKTESNEALQIKVHEKIDVYEQSKNKTTSSSIFPNKSHEDNPTPRQITVVLPTTGDRDHDRRRIKTIYGTLISFHGTDRFSFQIFENGVGHLIDFTNDTTRICPELLERLKRLMGKESWIVDEMTSQ